MTGLFLSIWFYVYAGLMFSIVSYSTGLFHNLHWLVQVIFWPVLLAIQAVKIIRESNFGWFVRYSIFKISHRND